MQSLDVIDLRAGDLVRRTDTGRAAHIIEVQKPWDVCLLDYLNGGTDWLPILMLERVPNEVMR